LPVRLRDEDVTVAPSSPGTGNACASAPVALVALPHAPAAQGSTPSAGASGAGATVLVREVSVPAYLDGFPVVVGRRGSALAVSRDTEWAERPSTGATRVLRDALSERLGASRVLIAGDGRIPDADLTVEFFALDPQPGTLALQGQRCVPTPRAMRRS